MTRTELLTLAKQFLALPTAPYHEHHVSRQATDYARRTGLITATDRSGNLIMSLPGTKNLRAPSLVFVAHMDHPGFEILDAKHAQFLGGVPTAMFAGSRVRVHRADGSICIARIRRVIDPKKKIVAIEPDRPGNPVAWNPGDFGTWRLPACRVTGSILRALAIDDVLSVVVALATMAELKRLRNRAPVWTILTRAEEVGFHGAIDIARDGTIPATASIISLEMSKQRPWARMGQGPVIRVGDRISTFDPLIVYQLQTVAADLQKADTTFKYQRALMDGGACEATAFAGHGYHAAGLCLPLGNYHNIGPREKPAAEYVSIDDLENCVKLTVAAARGWRQADRVQRQLAKRIRAIRRAAPRRLT